MELDEFTTAYLETALWSSTDESNDQGGEPLDKNYTVNDITLESIQRMVADCKAFQEAHWELISENPARAGHDFWLTRNRHGAGFWDGDWPKETGELLTKAAHVFGEVNLYIGDDDQIWLA